MNEKTKHFYESVKDKNVFFLGAGVSHRELIPRLVEKGALVTLCDKKPLDSFGEYGELLKNLGVQFRLGEGYLDNLTDADLIFRSPGIDYTKPEIQAAVTAGIKVTSEIETFFELCDATIIGITGSDGKTTTSSLTAAILESAGKKVYLGGNIGAPLLPRIDDIMPDDFVVVELSSFQLISMRNSPKYALVTNVTPNHLDHHKDMREYIDAKRNILLYQGEGSAACLFDGNDVTLEMRSDVKGELRMFGRNEVENGAYVKDGAVYLAIKGKKQRVVDITEINLLGAHNQLNVAGAVALTSGLAEIADMRRAIKAFHGVEHRIEFVRELEGVKWYNDSISTSPTRTIAGLRSFEQKLIVIAGGSSKGIPFDPMAKDVLERVKVLLLTGATASAIEETMRNAKGFEASGLVIEQCGDIPSAVARARQIAKDGDIVTLCPACPSFDSYPNFEVRGRHYKDLVNAL